MTYVIYNNVPIFFVFNYLLIISVDTVATGLNNTVDATQKATQSAFDTGKSYASSAKGTHNLYTIYI